MQKSVLNSNAQSAFFTTFNSPFITCQIPSLTVLCYNSNEGTPNLNINEGVLFDEVDIICGILNSISIYLT